MSLNKVMLIGNVGRDPEVRYLDANNPNTQGRKVATFTLATSERYRDRNGELRENTEWHNIVAWGQSADVAERFVKKGTQLYIEGRLRTRSWTDQTGAKRYTTEINVDSLQLLGRREGGQDGNAAGGYQQQNYQPQQPAYQPQQQSYQQPQPQSFQQPAYQAPVQAQPVQQPSQQPINIDLEDNPADDLPF